MSSLITVKTDDRSWWERKHKPEGHTDINPSIGAEIAGPRIPDRLFATDSDPVGEPYPESYRPFVTLANMDYGQVYGDMPETKLLADRNRWPLTQVGWMTPFTGLQSAFPITK